MFRHRGTLVGWWVCACLFTAQNAQAFKIISFDGVPARWPDGHATYVVDSRGSADFKNNCDSRGPCVSVFQAIANSFDTWSRVSGGVISFQANSPKQVDHTGYDGQNMLLFVESGWTDLPFSPPTGALAVTISTYRSSDNSILDSDIHFNGEHFKWGVVDTEDEQSATNVIDVQNVATHEIGHFIGLDHSSEDINETDSKLYLATMFFASGPGETFRRDMNEDDIAAMQNLYPSAKFSPPVVESVTPGRIDAYEGTALVHITGSGFQPFASVVIATDSDLGDIVGRIGQITPTSIDVVFEVYALRTGVYDVVVSNTFDSYNRVQGALDVQGSGYDYGNSSYGPGDGSASSGGCSIALDPVDTGSAASALLMLLLPLILIGWSRSRFTR